jgi:hypothetical protein
MKPEKIIQNLLITANEPSAQIPTMHDFVSWLASRIEACIFRSQAHRAIFVDFGDPVVAIPVGNLRRKVKLEKFEVCAMYERLGQNPHVVAVIWTGHSDVVISLKNLDTFIDPTLCFEADVVSALK